MEKILITGANGMVGQALVRLLSLKGYEVIATGKGPWRSPMPGGHIRYFEADITHPFQLREIMAGEKPAIVVHGAAMTQVDDCELKQNEAHSINVEATARLLLDAEEYSSFFIFLSTDFVFDGNKGMYSEDDDVNPVSWYGQTKVEAEAIVQTAEIPWAIVRTCLVFGKKELAGRHNLYSWVRESLELGKPIKVVDDQWRTPTYVEDLAAGIEIVIRKKIAGIWHISGKDQVTPYAMALKIAKSCGLDASLITRVTADTFTQPGKRPAKTGFDISKSSRELGFEPHSLDDIICRLNG
ncbi:SDR family oxidoreductase [Flavihumibacter stibioxidans]|uniref:NAD(P)-dependent oxidoreductase n=1 Tax=Flavihumibacter stibioxidans TaxID=1834163 RepID=A0ABR7MDW9_9BACT|nr:SDR family oxidoreductase [Flavihumibacter stibioxidans]MBC6493142.1 NAD(P)-dependent oxidoreductase [Flavihumibacter stibioxidans]